MTSSMLAAVVSTSSGMPLLSPIRRCLLPVLRRSTNDGLVAVSLGVPARAAPSRLPARVHLHEQHAVQLVDYPRRPAGVSLAPLAGLAGAEGARLQRQLRRGDSRMEHEQDVLQTQSVEYRPGAAKRSGQGQNQSDRARNRSSMTHGLSLTFSRTAHSTPCTRCGLTPRRPQDCVTSSKRSAPWQQQPAVRLSFRAPPQGQERRRLQVRRRPARPRPEEAATPAP